MLGGGSSGKDVPSDCADEAAREDDRRAKIPRGSGPGANMNALTIFLSTLGVALALGGSEGPKSRMRSILREKVDARGVVGADLAAQTGWSVARGFQWQILLPDAEGRY